MLQLFALNLAINKKTEKEEKTFFQLFATPLANQTFFSSLFYTVIEQ